MKNARQKNLIFFVIICINFLLIRNFWFHSDDWFWFTTLSKDLTEILTLKYSSIHLSAVPGFIFKIVLSQFGLDSYILLQIILLSINFGLLIIIYAILKYETSINSLLLVLFVCLWYTNPWGRENIRWPQQISTNISLLSYLTLFFLIRKGNRNLLFAVPVLTTIGIFSTSWSFAYFPFILGAILDLKVYLSRRIQLIVLSILPHLFGLIYIYSGKEFITEQANYLNVLVMLIFAPLYAVLVWAPWGSFNLIYVLNFLAKTLIATWLIIIVRKSSAKSKFRLASDKRYTILGILISIFSFVFSISIGRSSETIFIPLSSRFAFILSLLFLMLVLIIFGERLALASQQITLKISLGLLLFVQIISLGLNLQIDSNREKWERKNFNTLISIRDSGGKIPNSCCNMDPGVDPETYVKIFSFRTK